MHGKNTRIFAAFFFLTLLTVCQAELSVSIQPLKNTQNVFYTDEILEFQLVAINLDDDSMLNEKFQVLSTNELQLLEEYKEVPKLEFEIPEIQPHQTIRIPFFVKAQSSPAARAVLSASFGQTTYTHLVAATYSIQKPPLEITTSVKTQHMALNETNQILVQVKNDSNRPITNFRIQAALENHFQELSPHAYQLGTLDVNQSIPPQEFDFIPKGNILGKANAGTIIEFTDENGSHTIDKRFGIDVADKSSSLLLALLLIAVLGFIFLSGKASKSENTQKKETSKK